MNCHSSIAQQGALIAEQMSSSQRDPSPLHLLIFACFSQAHRTENLRCGHTNICFDVGSLGVKWIEMVWDLAQSCDLEPSEREVAREMQSLPSTQFTKAPCRHATSACNKCSSHPHTPRCSCESSWFHWVPTNSYNRLKHMNCHSSIAQQGALIAEQMSSSQRDPSPLHLLIFACFSQAHRTENLRCGHTNICFDVGSLGVKWIEMVWDLAQSCDLEPSEREVAREMQSLPSTQFAKPRRHVTFCLQNTMMRMTSTQIQMQVRKNNDAGPPWVRERQWPEYRTQKLDLFGFSHGAVENIWRNIVRLHRL